MNQCTLSLIIIIIIIIIIIMMIKGLFIKKVITYYILHIIIE